MYPPPNHDFEGIRSFAQPGQNKGIRKFYHANGWFHAYLRSSTAQKKYVALAEKMRA